LLLGYGSIARAAVPTLRALGLDLVAYRRRPAPGGDVPQVGRESLLAELAAADAVLCTLPLTGETRGLIGERELAAMKETAVLVNVGRGAVIDEEALYRALAERRIYGAGIDVWYVYPGSDEERSSTPPSRFPFGELPNVVMTPHSANDMVGWREAAAATSWPPWRRWSAARSATSSTSPAGTEPRRARRGPQTLRAAERMRSEAPGSPRAPRSRLQLCSGQAALAF